MSYINDYIEDSDVIYIDGTENELVPGLNDMMAKMAELFIDTYMEPDYLNNLTEDEMITIDFTALSDEEMQDLITCAIVCAELETNDNSSGMYLS